MFVLFLFGHCKKDKHYNGQREKGQTLQWPKRKMTNITMTKDKKDKHYNGQREKRQILPLAIVMFVLFLFGHCNVFSFSLWSL
jgi:hypothetical protein